MKFVDRKERTPRYEAAVTALRELSKEDRDLVHRAYAEAQAPWIESFVTKGLKRSSGVRSHLRLLGKRPSWGEDALPEFADHTDLWVKDGKPHLLTTQPYQLNSGGIRDLAALIDEGFDATISSHRSWYFPASTVLIEITKAS